MVLNLSRGGLFVQTGAHVSPGSPVELELNLGRDQSGIPVNARVVWRRSVVPQLRSVSQGGLGVRIHTASEHYFQFLSNAIDGSTGPQPKPAAATPAEAPNQPAGECAFRVRLKQTTGPRTRWIDVRSASETGARERALSQAGDGWAVLECQPAPS